jgi:radical SAM family uncharacterized protein/radical SAM-linked protein
MARLDQSVVEGLISKVQKPGRYIGRELNIIVKEKTRFRMALSYPDLYEVGMSNNGLRILYDIVNRLPDVACERVFAADADLEQSLRMNNIPLYTLETYTPLCELDMLGFNLSHELLYTNLLQILDLGRIPLLRAERRESDPIIIAGGEAASNPFPLSDFIDLFFIGDGEEGIVEIVRTFIEGKERNLARSGIVDRMGSVEGALVPSRYRVRDDSTAAVTEGPAVRKRVYRERTIPDPARPIVPNIRTTQERAVIEATRGCNNFCNFCHAGYYDLPYRYYDYRILAERIFEIIRNTGYDEVTLSSLSISDYPHFASLVDAILPRLTEKGISVSLPSLRVDAAMLPLIEKISGVRRASLTFAVESASEQIRARANKSVLIQNLIEIVSSVYQHGWKVIKLYFMIGLPGCDRFDEAADIVRLLREIYRIGGRRLDINVTVSPFVPKPHTPFEGERQMDAAYFENAVRKIKQGIPRGITIKNHNVRASILEGLLARGDARLGGVILHSYLDGCRFDSWDERFRFDIWRAHLDRWMPDWERLLSPEAGVMFPWKAVITGFERILKAQQDKCVDAQPRPRLRPHRGGADEGQIEAARESFSRRFAVRKRIRLRLAKTGMMRFIPHNDFIEIIKRGLRIAGAPVAMTQGFNKRERMSSGFPLPLGIESEAELVDIELFDCLDDGFKARLSSGLPPGIEVADVHYIDKRVSLMDMTDIIEYQIKFTFPGPASAIIARLSLGMEFTKKTKKSERRVVFDAVVHSYGPIDDSSLFLRLYTGTEDSMRIDDAMSMLAGIEEREQGKMRILKTGQFRNIDGRCELII